MNRTNRDAVEIQHSMAQKFCHTSNLTIAALPQGDLELGASRGRSGEDGHLGWTGLSAL